MSHPKSPHPKSGDIVKVHYTGRLEDGTVFDSSIEREPLEFKLGSGEVIPGFEEAVADMGIGESKTVMISSDDAYGPYNQNMVAKVNMEQFPENIVPHVGQQLQVRQSNGESIVVKITEIDEEDVTLDANHPLAGKDLIFEIELVEIDFE